MAINYDLPVRDLIRQLTQTGHVTRTTYRKTMVTLHHNAGVGLSHEDLVRIWTDRPASAQFNIDNAGSVGQFVEWDQYAWACGDFDGNSKSISIEMANESGAPIYGVSEKTWQSAARLAGWLFAHKIGARPTNKTLVGHNHWSATGCPGPHIAKVYPKILTLAQHYYDLFTGAIEEDVPMDWETFKEYMTRWWVYHSRQRGSDFSDGPTAPEMLDSIVARNLVLDVNEEELAQALIARGLDPTGVSLNKMKSAFAEVLGKTMLVPPPVV